MTITHLLTGLPFMTVGPGTDEADVSIPAFAQSLHGAVREVVAAYQFDDNKVHGIDTLPMSRGKTMLAVYSEPDPEHPCDPLVLVYHGDLGCSQADLNTMSRSVLEQFTVDNPAHLSGDDPVATEDELRATVRLMMDRMRDDVP